MTFNPILEPFATFVVGSLPRPQWLRQVIEERKRGEISCAEADELIDAAVPMAIRLQERAGPGARGIPAHTWHFSSQVGRFHLRDLAPGVYDLLLLSKGAVTGRVKGVTIRAGEETGPVSISPGD